MIDLRALELAKSQGYRPHGNWQHMVCDPQFWAKLAEALNPAVEADGFELAADFFGALIRSSDMQSVWNALLQHGRKPINYKPMRLSSLKSFLTISHPDPFGERAKRIHALLKDRFGEDIYSSWFSSLEFGSFDGEVLIATVPVKFLKRWIIAHYYDDLLECCANELEGVQRIDIILRYPRMS